MAIKFRLIGLFGGKGGENQAGVSPNGEVLIREFNYSDPIVKQLTDTTITNFVEATDGKQFVLTGMYASGDRSINNNGELLEIYESEGLDSGTQEKLLFSVDIPRQGNANPALPPMLITHGRFVNADRTNITGAITVTITGYFVPKAPA